MLGPASLGQERLEELEGRRGGGGTRSTGEGDEQEGRREGGSSVKPCTSRVSCAKLSCPALGTSHILPG